jgi:glycosyltransferase involved in cell wall biosynthesis
MTLSRRMRLALFSDSLEPSGVGQVMLTLARHLPPERYELFLVCADDAGADPLAARMREHVAGTARLTVRSDDDLDALHALVEQLRAWKVDVFHNHIGATWEGDFGTLAARCAEVPLVVVTEHLPNVLRIPHELEQRARMNRLLDRIFAVSESVRQSLIAAGLASAEQVVTVENGVHARRWSRGREAARRELGLPQNAPVVLFLGRLVEQKDPLLLLEAMRRLLEEGGTALALFAGDGWMRGAVEERAERLRLQSHVHVLGGRSDVDCLLAAADVLAMPSRFEGLPLAALEAMSAGLPIVGCDAPGVRDAVAHGSSGWLAPVGDAAGLARGLQLALNEDPGKRWSQAAVKRYEGYFTAQKMAQRMDNAYQEAWEAVSLPSPLRHALR